MIFLPQLCTQSCKTISTLRSAVPIIFRFQVIERYKSDGFEFLLNAFNDAKYLEEISGLTELQTDPLGAEVKQ